MRTPDPRLGIVAVAALALTVVAAPSAGAATTVVPPVLLDGPGPSTEAVDITPLGVVVGSSGSVRPYPDEPADDARPYRWTPRLDGTFRSQALALPDGATRGVLAGVGDLGIAGGTVVTAGAATATRWSLDGRTPTAVGPSPTLVDAVAPGGQVVVETPPPSTFGGKLELVARDGTRTDVTAPLGDPYARGYFGRSAGGPNAVSFSALGGVGYGSYVTFHVWSGGAVATLPVRSGFLFGSACVSRVLADGTVAYSGPDPLAQVYRIGVHRGGVPGTEEALPVPDGLRGQLPCPAYVNTPDAIDADGTVVGSLSDGEGAVWRNGTLTRIPPQDGETWVQAVAVASGGRAVLDVTAADGTRHLYLWCNGTRRELQIPAGWQLRSVVELTVTGLVLANVQKDDGSIRPVVWSSLL